MQKKTYIILHNIRSVHNVGSIFRTADTAGISEVIMSGYTPTPMDRFGRPRKDIAKIALGAENIVPWSTTTSLRATLSKLKNEGVRIIAIEQHKNSIDYKKIKKSSQMAFMFGNEVRGLSDTALKQCDVIAEIPMKGSKESLNVAVSAGVTLFRILNI